MKGHFEIVCIQHKRVVSVQHHRCSARFHTQTFIMERSALIAPLHLPFYHTLLLPFYQYSSYVAPSACGIPPILTPIPQSKELIFQSFAHILSRFPHVFTCNCILSPVPALVQLYDWSTRSQFHFTRDDRIIDGYLTTSGIPL